jgi:predicted membrane channel-forming protein YqfA (hemolysin III family)
MPSLTRIVRKNPRAFLILVAAVGLGGFVMQLLAATVPDSESLQAGVFLAMALAAAVYVGSTQEDYDD